MTMLFSLGTPVSSTNKADRHDKTEILLKVELNTITQPLSNPKSLSVVLGFFDIAGQAQYTFIF
jgi:hypothetical protein